MPERRFNWKCIDCGKADIIVFCTAKGGKIPTWCSECRILYKREKANLRYHKNKSSDVQTYTMHRGEKCEVEDCPKDTAKREWCEDHYRMWLKTGDPLGYTTRPQGALQADSETGLKLCCSCNSKLPVDRFHIANQNKDGRVVYCIDCV